MEMVTALLGIWLCLDLSSFRLFVGIQELNLFFSTLSENCSHLDFGVKMLLLWRSGHEIEKKILKLIIYGHKLVFSAHTVVFHGHKLAFLFLALLLQYFSIFSFYHVAMK